MRINRTVASSLAALLVVTVLGFGLAAGRGNTTPAPGIVLAQHPGLPASTATLVSSPTAAPTPTTSDGSTPPTEGRWIDVDVTRARVRLMDGGTARREIAPVAYGAQVDSGAYESTQTGLFHIYAMHAPLAYDTPYKSYISHWVAFDPARDNGFHSFLKDEDGKVVDASTGSVSNGCIRTADPEAIYAFAEIGMPVYVHH